MRATLLSVLAIVTMAVGYNAHAQQDNFPREESFVYATTYYDGQAYNSGVVTPNVDTIYLLAGREHAIAPRETLIYYWSLTNEYLADWAQKNEIVAGNLEITRGGRVVAEIPLTDFVIQYDADNITDTVTLIGGAEAETAFATFQQQQDAFREASFAYYRAQQAWEQQMREIVRNNPPGTVAEEDLPAQPRPPIPFSLFSTDPIAGYIVSLPAGTYQIRMVLPDGTAQPGSEKRLVMFEPSATGVSYGVTPQSRWTRPEESRRPNSTIYAPHGTTLYLRPHEASAVPAHAHYRMNNPQGSASSTNRVLWIPHQPLTDAGARLEQGTVSEQVSLSSYYVRQLVRDSRGYDIIPWDESVSEQPTFDGFQVDVSVNAPVQFELLDDAGNSIPGSQREVRALLTTRAWLPYLLSLLPLVAGVMSMVQRRRGTQRVSKGVS